MANKIQYGLISETDARTLEKTIDLLDGVFDDMVFNVLEVGVYGGDTAKGLKQYIESGGHETWITGIDNKRDNEDIRFNYDDLIIGNSNEVYNKLPDESQHLIFIDGCHCFAHVVSDFFCYAPKVKNGGFIAFHDTGKHIKPFKDFQHGDKSNPDAYISVRKGLEAVGLSGRNSIIDAKTLQVYLLNHEWGLTFDEADPTDEAGGVCVFKKLY